MAGRDSIIRLPVEVIDRIMGFLPIQQAAKAAAVSKVWGDAWSSLTRLCFDNHFFRYFDNKFREEDNGCVEKPSCWSVMNKVLLEHKGHIWKFVFIFSSFRMAKVRLQPCDLDQLLLIVTQRGVEEIHLSFGFNEYKLPDCVSTCSTLIKLYLHGFSIDPRNSTWTLPNATSLCFEFVYFGTRNLSNYVFDVPKLENLSFISCKDVFLFNITPRNLSSLTIYGCYSSKIGSFLPVNMDLKSICTLAFDNESLLDFLRKTTTKGLSIQLPTLNVELLKVSNFCFQDKARISAFVRLLCKCPKLCRLEIKFQTLWGMRTNVNKCMDAASGHLINLRSVVRRHEVLHFLKLSSFKGLRPQMHFIQEMLGWLPALEKVVIIGCPYRFDWNKEHETMEEILQFPRASTKAQIVCK